MSRNLFTILRSRFPADGAATLIERPDGSRLSYDAMLSETGAICRVLTTLGVRPGDRVAAQTAKSAEALMLYLAVLRLGAVYLPLNDAYTPAELDAFLKDAEPSLFVCAPEKRDGLLALARQAGVAHVETLGQAGEGSLADKAAGASTEFDDCPRSGGDLAAILYTSGTTGRSKGAMLTHANLASNAATLRDAWAFTEADRLLHALPIYHTHGLFVATNVTLMAGASMILLPSFSADAVVEAMPQATAMMGVPTHYTRLLAHPAFSRDLTRHMRLFVSGSAPLAATTHEAFRAVTGHAILERYGMTETGMNTSNPYGGERIAGSVGPALPGVEIRVADPATGKPLAQGEVGSIEIRGPNVFTGYWRMPDRTREEFRDDGFLISGDLGTLDAAGYLRIVGRAKDLIISGGLNVYPAEVEAAIERQPGVAQCAVIGVPHADFGEAVVAVLTARPGARPDEAELRQGVAATLARYKQPKRFVTVDSLPVNAMGKVQKAVLRETYAGMFATEASSS